MRFIARQGFGVGSSGVGALGRSLAFEESEDNTQLWNAAEDDDEPHFRVRPDDQGVFGVRDVRCGGDEFDVDGFHDAGNGSDVATAHERAEAELAFPGEVEAPEDEDGVGGEDDVGGSGPGALKEADLGGGALKIAVAWEFAVPDFRDWVALQEDHDHLVDVEDEVGDPDSMEDPAFLSMCRSLDSEEQSDDCNLTKSNGEEGDDLADPAPFVRLHDVVRRENPDVVTNPIKRGECD